MCDPITIASAALTVGSTVAGMAAQSKVNNARNQAMTAENARQEKFDREADALNLQARDRYKNVEGQQAKKSKALGDYLAGRDAKVTAPPENAPAETMPTSASNVITREVAKQSAKAKAYTDQQGQALGAFRSFGDVLGGLSRQTARDAGYLNQVHGFKKGSAGVLAAELDAANGAGNGLKFLGDIMGAVGSMGMNAGLTGNVAPAISSAAGAAGRAGSNVSSMFSLPTFAQAGNPFRVY